MSRRAEIRPAGRTWRARPARRPLRDEVGDAPPRASRSSPRAGRRPAVRRTTGRAPAPPIWRRRGSPARGRRAYLRGRRRLRGAGPPRVSRIASWCIWAKRAARGRGARSDGTLRRGGPALARREVAHGLRVSRRVARAVDEDVPAPHRSRGFASEERRRPRRPRRRRRPGASCHARSRASRASASASSGSAARWAACASASTTAHVQMLVGERNELVPAHGIER